jgi:hypothetical protein
MKIEAISDELATLGYAVLDDAVSNDIVARTCAAISVSTPDVNHIEHFFRKSKGPDSVA